jgi:3-hydroxyisobutyrate dehydrogenase-like beta-hydroxyacid dehydrogenase
MMASKTSKVGFIGLGIMGGPMALNLLKAGFAVTVYNRTPEKTLSLRQAGAAVAGSIAELAAGCDVICSCVTDNADVLQVHLGEDGVRDSATAGSIVIDFSTVAPAVAKEIAPAMAARGVAFLDAPVSGGDIGAKAGTLSIMVGGDRAAFDRAAPVLAAMGKTITYCGPSGSGYVVKLSNQIMVALNLMGVVEALALAEQSGVDPKLVIQAVGGGAASNWALLNLGPKMIAGDYRPGFFVDYVLKDLNLVAQTAHELNMPLLGTPIAEALFRVASAAGHGRDGTQAAYLAFKTLRGKNS